MAGPITRRRDIESLKTAARWPGADRNTTVILATRLAAARADADGYRYFSELAAAQPGEALPLAIAGFFQARLGEDVDAALAKLDQAAATALGPPQYFRGLALAGLPPDRRRAEQAIADLEFVLAVRDQFPPMLLRAVHHGLAAAHATLGQHDQAAEAERKSGLGAAPADTQLMFGGFWATAADGFRFTSPRIWRPEPGIQVAQGYDFADLAFIATSDGIIAIDAGTTPDRVKAALDDLDPPPDGAISHLILTHAHWDHIGGAGALTGPGTRVIAQAGFPAGLDRRAGGPATVPLLHRRRRQCTAGRHPRPADQPAHAPDRRGHRACPLPDAGRGNSRRADGPPSGQRRAVRRRRAHALPGTAIRRRRLPGRAPADPRLHRQPAAPAAHPRPRHADRAVHRRGGPGPAGGTDPAARRGAGRHPRRPHPPRHPGAGQPPGRAPRAPHGGRALPGDPRPLHRAALPPAHRLLAARRDRTRTGDRRRARRRP